jgi:hypothetical protein
MSSFKISTVSGTHNGLPAILPAHASLKVAIGSQSAQSAAIQSKMVRLVATSDCHIAFGTTNPVAAADGTSIFLPAGIPEYFVLNPGDKIAVIQDAFAGSLFISSAV